MAQLSDRSNFIWPVGPFEKYYPPQKIAYLKDAAHHIVGGDGHDVAVIIAAGHLEINDTQVLASAIANTIRKDSVLWSQNYLFRLRLRLRGPGSG